MNERDEELLRRFLSGEATASEREQIEHRFMTDDAFFESLSALEHEMMVDLVHGRLSAAEAASFERAVNGAPDRRRRLEDVRATVAAVRAARRGDAPPRLTRPVRWLALAATLVVATGSWALLWRTREEPPQVAGGTAPPRVAEPVVRTALLRPGPSRSDAATPNVIAVDADASVLRLMAVLDSVTTGPVEARIRPVGGAPIEVPPTTTARRVAGGLEISWDLPASAVAPGDYLVTYSRVDAGSGVRVGTRFVRITK